MRLTFDPTTLHPIAQAEYLYQQRAIAVHKTRRWWDRLRDAWWRLSVASTLFIFAFKLGEGLGLYRFPPQVSPELTPIAFAVWFVIPAVTLMPTVILMHFGLLIRTLLWASNSIPREKVGGTWDLLLLTGVSSRELVMSKWSATVRRAWRSYLWLALLRVGAALWLVSWSRTYFNVYPVFSLGSSVTGYVPISPDLMLVGTLIFVAMTLASLPMTAAIGMIAAFLSKRSNWNTGVAFFLRTGLMLTPLILTGGVGFGYFQLTNRFGESFLGNPNINYFFETVLMGAVQTSAELLTNGAFFGTQAFSLNSMGIPITTQQYLGAGLMIVIAFVYYFVLTWLALWVAQLLARWQQTLEQAKRKTS